MVTIVDDPSKGFDPIDPESMNNLINHEGKGPCKHLRGDKPGEYSCALHDYPWYKDTPCHEFAQIEHGNTECRMGRFVLDGRLKT